MSLKCNNQKVTALTVNGEEVRIGICGDECFWRVQPEEKTHVVSGRVSASSDSKELVLNNASLEASPGDMIYKVRNDFTIALNRWPEDDGNANTTDSTASRQELWINTDNTDNSVAGISAIIQFIRSPNVEDRIAVIIEGALHYADNMKTLTGYIEYEICITDGEFGCAKWRAYIKDVTDKRVDISTPYLEWSAGKSFEAKLYNSPAVFASAISNMVGECAGATNYIESTLTTYYG